MSKLISLGLQYEARWFSIGHPVSISVTVIGQKMPEEVTTTVTDRAYTSPIWYTP